jgi:hypothetical protein
MTCCHKSVCSLLTSALVVGLLVSFPSFTLHGDAAEIVKIDFGKGVYPEEQWEPGKFRRWIGPSGEILLINDGPPVDIDVRFVAESFRIPRLLRAVVGETVLLETVIPPSAPLFVAVKRVSIKSGTTVLTLAPAEPADRISQFQATSDNRQVSVAIGPISVIDSNLPEAIREQTGAFPDRQTQLPFLTAKENEVFNLAQQGRLQEAWYAYRDPVIASGRGHPLIYAVAGLTALALDDLDGAVTAFALGTKARGGDPYALEGRKLSALLGPYLHKSEMLASRSADPGRAYRESGEIYRAVSVYHSILVQDSANPQATYWLGFLSLLGDQFLDVRRLFGAFIETRPGTEDARVLKDLLAFLPH